MTFLNNWKNDSYLQIIDVHIIDKDRKGWISWAESWDDLKN